MKINYIISLSASISVCVFGAYAQNNENAENPLGYIVRQAEFKISDMYELSRFSANMGTARSAAMAGAFASLGADLSSMNINPAGLGMYRTSEFGITGSLMLTGIKNSATGMGSTTASRMSVGLNNVGIAFNVYEGSGAVTSFTFGMNYNKLADFNYRSTIDIARSNNSILDMFGPTVANYANDVSVEALSGNTPWKEPGNGGAYLQEWGAVLAYKTGLIRYNEEDDNFYRAITADTNIANYLNTVSRGSIGEYTFSGGWNFSNRFYFGFSLGILDYYNRREITYSEDYTNNTAQNVPPASNMTYSQKIRTVGDGYNLKLGVIIRPIDEIRIGLAYHSASIVSLKTTYDSEMQAAFESGITNEWTPTRTFYEYFNTPTRFLAGVSYILNERAIIALDYEHTWYGNMKVRGSDYNQYISPGLTYADWYKQQIEDHFQGAHTLRLGGEMETMDNLFARAGLSYTHEGLIKDLRNGNLIFDVPIDKSSLNVSAGLGFRFTPSTSLDLTYVYTATRNTLYDPYFFETSKGEELRIGEEPFEITRNRHNLMLSFSYKF